MKCKVFFQSADKMEAEINKWVAKDKPTKITSLSTALAPPVTVGSPYTMTATVFYE